MTVTTDAHPSENLAVTRTVFLRSTALLATVGRLDVYRTVTVLLLSSEMFYQLIRHTSTILRRSCSPSSLSSLHHSPISRAYSWSGQSQPANWGHLSNVYGKGVEMSQREDPMSPDASWTTQSRNRMQILRPPKGPYAGKTLPPSVGVHDFLIYQSRKECRSEKRQRCRCTE